MKTEAGLSETVDRTSVSRRGGERSHLAPPPGSEPHSHTVPHLSRETTPRHLLRTSPAGLRFSRRLPTWKTPPKDTSEGRLAVRRRWEPEGPRQHRCPGRAGNRVRQERCGQCVMHNFILTSLRCGAVRHLTWGDLMNAMHSITHVALSCGS
ncbi:hypothetical protein NDU88_006787 [Pleurodeles waltl]|uniref:Uncharacterized protein n=1 Tax=Pleurodeles waltl TaxID=8319 RepID=A0AAV7PJE2_PLEWA|nr:hypothetical protein NDU88_006787 [Pleurodeles waltl]